MPQLENGTEPLWIAEHMQSFQETAASKATTMGHIQRHHLTQAMCTIPKDDFFDGVGKKIAPPLDRLTANNLENRTLAALRDLLLPKLMSGEIRVNDAEKIVGNAT